MTKSQRFLPVLICLLYGANSKPLQAEPAVHLQQVYYDIDASTTPALHSQVLRYGPRDKENRPAQGLTRWKVHWAFKLSQSLLSCTLIEVKTSVHILVTVPRVNPQTRDRMSDQIRRQLEDFLQRSLNTKRSTKGTGRGRPMKVIPACVSCRPIRTVRLCKRRSRT